MGVCRLTQDIKKWLIQEFCTLTAPAKSLTEGQRWRAAPETIHPAASHAAPSQFGAASSEGRVGKPQSAGFIAEPDHFGGDALA